MTLNPHIKKLFVRNTSLERLDATLQFYPNLEELDLSGNKIQVGNLVTNQLITKVKDSSYYLSTKYHFN